jgi:ABC-type uncharacterized transport system substrate-binding protein
MNKRKLGSFAVCVMLLAFCASAEAQQENKIPRVGYLNAVSPSEVSDRIEALRRGLRELGYVEGKNIVIESRYAEGKLDRLPALATELVRLKVDVIVTSGLYLVAAGQSRSPHHCSRGSHSSRILRWRIPAVSGSHTPAMLSRSATVA